MGGANRFRQAYECWQRGDFAMAESHGTREFIGSGELVPHAAQTRGRRLRQAYECWQCGDFAMVDSLTRNA